MQSPANLAETPTFTAPSEVLDAYYPDGIAGETILSGGKVNTTLLVTDKATDKSILQRLNPVFDESMTRDFEVVSRHLQAAGWEVADVRKASDGQSYTFDEAGHLWRSFTYIDLDGTTPMLAAEVREANITLSGLLGSLHSSLAVLDYIPQFSLPHFHNTAYYADRLEGLLPNIRHREIREMGERSICLSKELAVPYQSQHIIHGDPKLTNALYRDGTPFTFIDFDTMMRSNPLIDLGDLLRSVAGKLITDEVGSIPGDIDQVVAAYYESAKPMEGEAEFKNQAYRAGRLLALELGMRYLIDSVEDGYFEWEPDQFESRQAHNEARAQNQWQAYEALQC